MDPPGYVRRRYLDESPSNPHFQSTDLADIFVTQEEAQTFVTRGSFPKSWLIPGTNTSIGLSGFVRMDANYDFQPVGNDIQFTTSTIPVPQERGQNSAMSFNWNRLSLETHMRSASAVCGV
jgi:hypothetical protein